MKWLLVACVLAGCQAKSAPPVDPAYARDITKVCNALTLAPDADTMKGNARQIVIAKWLGAELETQASRDWLAEIQPLVGAAKADAMNAEANKVGLDRCALAAEWGGK